jgi:simple sugar transport system ATP-binding protein
VDEDYCIILRNISKSYAGVEALDDVDLSIRKGEVHCLIGENGSGKSTLIKIIAGVVTPSRGASITVNGKPYTKLTPIDAIHQGIQIIYQDLSLFPNMTVAENIAMNQLLESGKKSITRQQIEVIAKKAMQTIGIDLPLDALVGDIPIAKQQCVAISRAVTCGDSLIIMDEPTSSLGKKDIEYLFTIIRTLKSQGISILFVGHKLNEIFEIADRVTILKDGKNLGTHDIQDLTHEKIIELMTGRSLTESSYTREYSSEKPLLEVKNLSKVFQFKEVSFRLYPGEIIGITGLVGSGRTELVSALFGLNPADSGEILIDGKPTAIRNVQDGLQAGICYVPEDRLTQGLFMNHSIEDNLIVTLFKKLVSRLGLLSTESIRKTSTSWVDNLAIKTPSVHLPVKQLSGGNQQRVVIAKWLARKPRILILDGPTIGVDVGAKEEIHRIIRDLAAQGLGIIFVSDEAPEVIQHSHRILLMREGRIIEDLLSQEVRETELLEKLG